ncbi:hypothetical protein OEZ49_01880 [Ruegeria sp. WL0004]|uniref:Uncharacterized protein n=1 Tax=Ruegeria marisflavi TaxID=2984152 RepID=A0ABT2WKS9_9RHOB|nr:hypothetical protein [Ruegeria sp. WL0004]MCU9836505.1 hypothetical protein [Ruegeria sp. WL0004]
MTFGYDVVREFLPGGEMTTGERVINQGEAAIVQRIFQEFSEGHRRPCDCGTPE